MIQNSSGRNKSVNQSRFIEFILFLDPYSKQFYSFSPQKRIIVQEKAPEKIKKQVNRQINELKILINHKQWTTISNYQRRTVPMSYLIESKYKFPVYLTHEELPKAMLEEIKFNENSILMKDQVIDFIEADIQTTHILEQLQYTRKDKKMVDKITTNIKLIASVNEVILTLGRIFLQDYCVVISTLSPKNKLIFKVKNKEQYLYGTETFMNFNCVREALRKREKLVLEIIEASVYDKQQYTKFFFTRNAYEVPNGEYAEFDWEQLMSKHEQMKFLMWYCPKISSLQPQSVIDMQKYYSSEELVRVNEKVKLKLQKSKRKGLRSIPRYLWKENILTFLEKRTAQIQSKFIELQNTVIYSGEVWTKFQFKILTLNNLLGLFKQQNFSEGKSYRRGFAKFLGKSIAQEPNIPQNLPTANQRFINFTECKKQGFIDIIPYMTTVAIEYAYGNEIVSKDQSQPVIGAANVAFNQKIIYSMICNLMLQISIIFKIKVYSKEGEGTTVGIGVLKLFDQFGYIRQGKQDIQLMAVSSIDMNRIGCISQIIQFNKNSPFLSIELPTFRKPVLWTLKDQACLKALGYLLSVDQSPQAILSQQDCVPRLKQIFSFNPIRVLKLTAEQKVIIKQYYKYCKNDPSKLLFYLYSVDWTDPYEIRNTYQVIHEWEPLTPVEALFLLNPKIVDEKIRLHAISRLQKMYEHDFIKYSNQLVQALVSFQTDDNALIDLIIEKCTYEPYTVGQQFMWQFRNRLNQSYTSHRFTMYLQTLGMISYVRDNYAKQIEIDQALAKKNEELIAMTEKYKEFDDKKPIFKSFVPEIQKTLLKLSPKSFFFAVRPQNNFIQIVPEQSKLFNSKKMPFCLACTSFDKQKPYRVMYKCGDDIKQDNLVLQLFSIFEYLWAEAGFDFKMSIYRVLSTGNQNGFIQIVEDAANSSLIHQNHGKDKIIKAFDIKAALSYLEYHNKGADLLVAKQNFLRSSVGYLVGTYVLGIGDRHSGNIMVQKNGKFFHIDFGHFLGNFKTKFNIKRERTPVTFTPEYAEVMGGQRSADFARFQQYCAEAFNILRKNSNLIINLLMMMVSAEIPQLRAYSDIQYVIDKLQLQMSKIQAAENIIQVVRETLESEARNIDNAFHEWNRGG